MMKKGTKATLCFSVTVIALIAVILLCVRSFSGIIEENRALATFEGPGSAIFSLTEPGSVKLWHDHQTVFNGRSFSYDESLPSGFTFSASPVGSTNVIPLVMSHTTETMTFGSTAKFGLGRFDLPATGDYEVTIAAPPGETRVFSLSRGGAFQLMGQIMATMIGCLLLGLVGIVTLIIGIVILATDSKPSSPPIPPHVT